jgi:hypothetical protein
MFPPTLVIDAGSASSIGWVRSSFLDRSPLGESGDASTLADAIDWLAARLRTTGKGTIGIEAPLWTPRRNDVRNVTAARIGEGNRPWSIFAGAGATTAGLGDMGFIFGRLAGVRATVRPETWARDGGLLIWEAFISGGGRGGGHCADAAFALRAFEQRCADLRSDLAPEPAVNLAVACALASGVLIDVAEIGDPAVVVKARKGEGIDGDHADGARIVETEVTAPTADAAMRINLPSANSQEHRPMNRPMGWDARAIHAVAGDKYCGLRQMFVAHGWPERGPKMMVAVQGRVKKTYGSVEAFERAEHPIANGRKG